MKRILITPLDWGLGHATRCIVIIRKLLAMQVEVYLAGSGSSLLLLREEFPALKYIELPGYHPVYPTSGSMVWKMAFQLPKFFCAIKKEHREVEEIIESEKIDLIISDNRYGCWSDKVPSIFITHQSNILMPSGFSWLQPWVVRVHENLIKRFTACWVPDYPGENSIAGNLFSGSLDKVIPVEFIGPLSRFTPLIEVKKKYDVVAILSGPEPQRSMLEDIVMHQLKNCDLRYFVVRGILNQENDLSPLQSSRTVNQIDFLSSVELQQVIEQSEIVIARSGYSTVMDLNRLGKKAIFIPTPGQTEQEYLANRLKEKSIAFCMAQGKFDLKIALEESKKYSGFLRRDFDEGLIKTVLEKDSLFLLLE